MISTALKQTLDNVRDNFTTTATGVVTTSFSLVILGTFILVYLNLIHLTQIAFQQSTYSIFLQSKTDSATRSDIQSYLQTVWGMAEIREVSAGEVRRQLINSFGDSGQMLEKLDFPKFPDIIEFTLNRPNELSYRELEEIRRLPGVSDVVFGQDTREQVNTFFTIAKFVGVFLIILLVVSIILIIHNSIQIALRIRWREIEIYKILGATSSFVQLPYLFEGIIIAVSGYFISLGVIYLLFEFVVAGITFNEATFGIRQLVRFFTPSEMLNSLILLVLLGGISSTLASNKIIKELDSNQP